MTTFTPNAAVEVYCENAGRLGTLSYLVPDGLTVHVGDAVRVPFGKAERYGVIVGAGDATKATRAVLEVFGSRASESEIELAVDLAHRHAAPLSAVAARLGPRSKRGNQPAETGPLAVTDGPRFADYGFTPPDHQRPLLACAPSISMFRVAALEAERLAADAPTGSDGTAPQVLVLCPTKAHIKTMLAQFESGAARLDTPPRKDGSSVWRGMVEGTVRVGIGSRASALWSARNLAGIVVVDESHPGFVEAAQPYTNAVVVAAERSRRNNLPCTLVTAVPSPTALGLKVKCVQVGAAQHFAPIHVVDRTLAAPGDRLVPPALRSRLKKPMPTIAVAPASVQRWRCQACKTTSETAGECCGTNLRPVSFGPERTASTLAPLVSSLQTFTLAQLLASSEVSATPTRVVLFDFDALVRLPELHPEMAAAAALHAASRLAGPAGEVVVCTTEPDAHSLQSLARSRDVQAFAKWTWQNAKEHNLPPFKTMAKVEVNRSAAPPVPAVGRVLGPRRVGGDEWELTVLLDDQDLDGLHRYVANLRRGGKVRFTLT